MKLHALPQLKVIRQAVRALLPRGDQPGGHVVYSAQTPIRMIADQQL